ncbi:TrkH family potassium uptake protein [Tissierella creatinini]|nr:TrkH family potassium uptake protein [Tissierella creatinini]TJX66153.1 TrkH family potassium uptake protein [Soehngenia saccharolytica]
MNYGIVLKVLGIILLIESFLMVPSYIISVFTKGNDASAFLFTILLTALIGVVLASRKKVHHRIIARDGFAIVTLGWIFASILGALPLYLAGNTTTYIDALFEIVSGFTTTGSTILANVEILPRGTLFWRSFTHWIGGMGILVFTLALLPSFGIQGFQIFKAESPGPVAGKIAPRIKDTAKILYVTYIIITLIQVILLLMGGMNLFDSFVFTFGTVGTGGFAPYNSSVGAYPSTYIHLVIGTFMILSGVNFSLYYMGYRGKIRDVFKDEELRLYLIIIVLAVLAIALNLFFTNYDSMGLALRDAYFQVSSIMTTTGYATVDFDLWPSFSKGILLLLMFTGASAGSTAGGMKVIRILVMLKMIKREVGKSFHPRAMMPIKVNGRIMQNETVSGIVSFMALYLFIFVVSSLLIMLEGVNIESAIASVAATLGNIGPGLDFAGPTRNFVYYSQPAKFLFTILMLLGRLELFTVISLIAPRSWRRDV